jgi:hypothetical protein
MFPFFFDRTMILLIPAVILGFYAQMHSLFPYICEKSSGTRIGRIIEMETASYTGKILTDGHLSVPEHIVRELGLRWNDMVHVILMRTPEPMKTEQSKDYVSNEEILRLAEERAEMLKNQSRPQLSQQHRQLITAIREEARRKGTLTGDYDEG